MLTRKDIERTEHRLLASYAMHSSQTQGRQYPEGEPQHRSVYQRDRDRIIHCTAFRRLEYKTQVFINHEGDYYRTRLTHSLEVNQIARGLARALRLNEDLAQTIALAHDLGHTPFGHSGEAAMNALMEGEGGFEHNEQSFRVVTQLEERYPNFRGINLSYEVLEGILKHTTEYDKPKLLKNFNPNGAPTLEAQIVNFSDEIAYMNHDLDDGLQYGMLNLSMLKEVPLWEETLQEIEREIPQAIDKVKRFRTISRLIHKLVTDLQTETFKRIKDHGIRHLEDVRAKGKNVVSLSDSMKKRTA